MLIVYTLTILNITENELVIDSFKYVYSRIDLTNLHTSLKSISQQSLYQQEKVLLNYKSPKTVATSIF